MTDASAIAITDMIGNILSVVIMGLIGWFMAAQKNKADADAKRVESEVKQVAKTLAETEARTAKELAAIKDDTGKTLVHVNDQFLIQLRLYRDSTQTIATLTNRPADQEKADAADKLYLEHKAKQEEAAAGALAVHKEHAGIAREQLEVQKKIEENTSPVVVNPK